MAFFKRGVEAQNPEQDNARLEVSPDDRAKAAKWFARARELGDKRQFDYALEYYINGLEFWPDAVEEACKPLHGCAVARRQMGGKKLGLKDTMKRSMTDKDPLKAYINALWLFSREPENLNYTEGVVRAAVRLRADNAALWAGGVHLKALESAAKASPKQCQLLAHLTQELGDRAADRGETALGLAAYQIGIDALNVWRRRAPSDKGAEDAIRNLSTKLTILKGKYKDSGSFRDSIADADLQRDLRDEQRTVQSEERLAALVAKARAEFAGSPEDPKLLKNLVDLLCRLEREEEENQAIGLLVNEYKRTGEYRWKQSADDIRIKQLGRTARELSKAGDEGALKKHQIDQLRFELAVFKERCDRYPTDYRLKFQYGVRCFRAGKFDDAIPLLQLARTDPKNRAACGLYLGRCFFRKGYHSQAVATLKQALEELEILDDELAKSMYYWLGQAQEAAGQIEDAKATYGTLLQIDYNYRDVRQRLDNLAK